jgi:hypothetical protein
MYENFGSRQKKEAVNCYLVLYSIPKQIYIFIYTDSNAHNVLQSCGAA